jgi:putative ABC transport system ATP-binding protein
MSETILKCSHLSRHVAVEGQVLSILDDVSLDLAPGQALCVRGASGSGKSTLLGLLAGLDRPSSGQIWLDGQELTALSEEQCAQVRARAVGFVFQSFHLLPGLAALDNVALPLELMGRADARQRALAALERVGLGARLKHDPGRLSGGEQQRVAIARAWALAPRVLFADEPTGNLDAATGERVADLLFELQREQGAALVLATHDERLAARCGRTLVLAGGRVQPENRA